MGKPISKVKRGFEEKKWEDDIEWVDFMSGKQIIIRIVGDVKVMARHWIDTITGKVYPQWCPQFDEEEEAFDDNRPCPAHDDFDDKAQKIMVGNCIVRSLQERGDDNPVRGFQLPHAVNDDLQDIVEIIHVDPADPEQGIDLVIRYNAKAKGNKKWGVQRGDRTPLKTEEKEYEYYNFDKIAPDFSDKEVQQEFATAMKEGMARNKYYVVQTGRVPEGARNPFKFFKGDPKGKPWTEFPELVAYRNEDNSDTADSDTKTKKKKGKEDDGQEEEIFDDDEENEEQDEEPVSKKRKSDDDDDEPPAKKKPKDDDDDEPPAKKKPKDDDDDPPAKKKPKDDDDEGGEDGGEADPPAKKKPKDDDESPPPKAKKEEAAEGKKERGSNEHPDPEIESKQHPKLGLVPECFEKYNGKAKCNRCPVRAKCIDESGDGDDDL